MMDEVTRCRYINCVDTHNEQIFHELPVSDAGLCVKWLIHSGHENLVGKDFRTLRSLKFFVCNNHFTNDCYLAKGTLKENAVPCPYWKTISTTKSSQLLQIENAHSQIDVKHTRNTLNNGNSYSREMIDQWCRTCATRKPNLVSMTTTKRLTDMSLLSKLKLLIEIDDDDVLPLKMCCNCVVKLEHSFQFFQQIYIADNTLRQIFPKHLVKKDQNGIKEEKISDSSNVNSAKRRKKPTDNILFKDSSIIKNVAAEESKTVFSLLTEPGQNDEELQWTDVLNVMNAFNSTKSKSKNPNSDPEMKCELCTEKFMIQQQLKNHLIYKHKDKKKNICIDCVICFKDETETLKHKAMVHDILYDCNHCQKRFNTKIKLKKHIADIHSKKMLFECNICDKTFTSEKALFLHVDSTPDCKNGLSEKKKKIDYGCTSCKTLCENENELSEHLKTHLKIKEIIKPGNIFVSKPDGIPNNKLGYKSNGNSENKFASMANEKSENKFGNKPDNKPNNEFDDKPDTKSDGKSDDKPGKKPDIIKPDEKSDSNFGSLLCPDCDSRLSNENKLKIHRMKEHLVEKNEFNCLLCEKETFNSVEQYNQHIQYHCDQENPDAENKMEK
ncbi:uncharacterized protein [Prorops nasuta]|uniref:uncharacterized protein n=1 Tax=Prorops nasuta TaxID=863751 RepID=UPI0034CED0B7